MKQPPIKPCPFCGAPASGVQKGIYFIVGCDGHAECRIQTSDRVAAVAIKRWNRRWRHE